MPPSEKPIVHRGMNGSLWGLLALLACPCHVPLVLLLLSGTTLGAALTDYRGLAFGVSTLLFAAFIGLAFRAARRSTSEIHEGQ